MDRRTFLEIVGFSAFPFKFDPTVVSASSTSMVCRADTVNSNKRVYPMKVLENMLADFDANHRNRRSMIGELGMPNDSIVHFANASHIVTDLKIIGKDLVATIETIETPSGKILKNLLGGSTQEVAFRTCGVGHGKVNEDGILIIDEDFKLVSIHAVPAKDACRYGPDSPPF
jgi:hypothetical protein